MLIAKSIDRHTVVPRPYSYVRKITAKDASLIISPVFRPKQRPGATSSFFPLKASVQVSTGNNSYKQMMAPILRSSLKVDGQAIKCCPAPAVSAEEAYS